MNDQEISRIPQVIDAIRRDTQRIGFSMTWPGKFTHLDLALSLLSVGGIYLIDDLLPQLSWPEGHAPKVPSLIAELKGRDEFVATKLAWATGLMILVRHR